ncbi:hypothetical protein DXG01_002082, partial [Tephrocybe rancida]
PSVSHLPHPIGVLGWAKHLTGTLSESAMAQFPESISLAFLVINNPAKPQAEPIGDALGWANLTDKQRQDIKVKYAAAGVKLLVSAFGDSQAPTTRGFSAIEVADKFAAWVKKYNLDGIDIDYLDDIFAEKSVTWVIDFTIHLRKLLPAGAYILTHAPLGPWFAPTIASGGYLKVNREVGNLIDWYNVQFFNQGNDYTTLDGLMFKSSSVWPQTSVFEIHQSANIPLSKIVIGKPATPGDAPSGGYVKPTDLAEWLAKGKEKGWSEYLFELSSTPVDARLELPL